MNVDRTYSASLASHEEMALREVLKFEGNALKSMLGDGTMNGETAEQPGPHYYPDKYMTPEYREQLLDEASRTISGLPLGLDPRELMMIQEEDERLRAIADGLQGITEQG